MSEEKQQSQTPTAPTVQTPKAVSPDGSEPKITRIEKTHKPKDPRRVEAGKRLAAISKSAKEKKARDREDRKRSPSDQPEEESQRGFGPSPSLLDWTIPMGGIIAAGLVGLYYAYTGKKQPTDTKADPPKDKTTPKDDTRHQRSATRRSPHQRRSPIARRPALDNFDD